MRRLSERARLEGILALRKALDSVRRSPSAAIAAGDEFVRTSLGTRGNDPSNRWLSAVEDQAPEAPGPELHTARTMDVDAAENTHEAASERDDLVTSLDRIADSIERIAAQLDSYHRERAEHLDAIEFLLREMLIGTISPAANPSTVLGGVIDGQPAPVDAREISLVPDEYGLQVDVDVEVRSRFHDRWIGGFSIAEAVNSPGRRRYRLTRRSDGIPLPILFDACDVRAPGVQDRQHAPS